MVKEFQRVVKEAIAFPLHLTLKLLILQRNFALIFGEHTNGNKESCKESGQEAS